MTEKQINFLGREYTISTQLPLYVEILQQFEGYSNELYAIVINQVKNGDYTGNAEVDFIEWKEPIESIAKRVIQSAARFGVYDLTVTELVDRNPGVKQLNNVCKNTFEAIKESMLASLFDFEEGMYNSGRQASSNITGSGISIWTNSLSSALIYSALEMSTIKRQFNEADREFKTAMADLDKRTTNAQEREQARILMQIYYPGCNSAIPVIISYMLEQYLKRIGQTDKFDYEIASKYDLASSSEILKNIDLIPNNADEVVIKAFEKCPYNPDVYKALIDIDEVDYETFETAKYLHQSIVLLPFIKEYVENRITQKLDPAEAIKIWASYVGMDEKEIFEQAYSDVKTTAMSQYKMIVNAVDDNSACKEWISKNIGKNYFALIAKKAQISAAVNSVIWNVLDVDTFNIMRKAGILETNEFNLTGNNSADFSTIMNDLSNKLTAKVLDIIETEEKKEEDRKKREASILTSDNEAIAQERLSVDSNHQNGVGKEPKEQKSSTGNLGNKKKTVFVICGIALAAIAFLLTGTIIRNNKYNAALALEDEEKYEEAVEAFEALGEYKDSFQHIEACERKQYETERVELIQKTNNSLKPYLELIGTGLNDNSVTVTQEFIDGKDNVFVMGHTGSVDHGLANDNDETITIMNWTSNDTVDDEEFSAFMSTLNDYFGEKASEKQYENFTDADGEVWSWSSKDGTWPICFIKDSRIVIRWYDLSVVK